LYVKFKNVKENAYSQQLLIWYSNFYTETQEASLNIGPFTLTMPAPSFTAGSSLNIPCHITNATTISLNPYTNTDPESVDIDENEVITTKFEWTLPSGWQTTSGQTGTFVSSSSINVIPPSSSSSTFISVRAQVNTQPTLQYS
jgi:hypothetical protein